MCLQFSGSMGPMLPSGQVVAMGSWGAGVGILVGGSCGARVGVSVGALS